MLVGRLLVEHVDADVWDGYVDDAGLDELRVLTWVVTKRSIEREGRGWEGGWEVYNRDGIFKAIINWAGVPKDKGAYMAIGVKYTRYTLPQHPTRSPVIAPPSSGAC